LLKQSTNVTVLWPILPGYTVFVTTSAVLGLGTRFKIMCRILPIYARRSSGGSILWFLILFLYASLVKKRILPDIKYIPYNINIIHNIILCCVICINRHINYPVIENNELLLCRRRVWGIVGKVRGVVMIFFHCKVE